MSKERIYDVSAKKSGIQYNPYEIERSKDALENKKLKNYVVQIPNPSGAGHVFSEIQQMALLTKQIYEEVETLIGATVNALDAIGINIVEMDNSIAEMFDGK